MKVLSAKLCAICSLKTTLETLLLLVNQYILTVLRFPCPIFLATLNVIAVCFVYLLLLWRENNSTLTLSALDVESGDHKILKMIDNWTIMKYIVPIGLYTATSLVCTNIAFIHIQISFVQSQNLLLPIALFVIQYFLGNTREFRRSFHPYYTLCLACVFIGLLVGYCGYFPILHVLFMCLTMFYKSVTILTTQEVSHFLSQFMNFSSLEMNCLLCLMVYLWLLLGCFGLEIPLFFDYSISTFLWHHFYWFVTSAGLSILITICNQWYLTICKQEDVTLLDGYSFALFSLFGLLGNVALFFIGKICGDEFTLLQLLGYAIALVGNGGYFAWQLYVIQYQEKHHIKPEDFHV